MNDAASNVSTSNWDSHLADMFDQSHKGEHVACMEILDKGCNAGVNFLKLHCVDCGTDFQADLIKDGQNAVVRKNEDDGTTDELWAKCPGCGCEWNGIHRHYYSVSLILNSLNGPFGMKGADCQLIGAVMGLDAKVGMNLAEEICTSEVMINSQGMVLQEIGRYDYRSILRTLEYNKAAADPNIKPSDMIDLQGKLQKEEDADNATRKARADMGRAYAAKRGRTHNGPSGDKQHNDIGAMLASLFGGGDGPNSKLSRMDSPAANMPPRFSNPVGVGVGTPSGLDNSNDNNNNF